MRDQDDARFSQPAEHDAGIGERGAGQYDEVQVDACLAALRAATCTELTAIRSLAGLPACNSTFATPLVAIGGKCGQDYECIDSVCQKAAGAWEGVWRSACRRRVVRHRSLRAEPVLRSARGNDDTDSVCVAEQDNGGPCVDTFDCKSRYCVAPADATAEDLHGPADPAVLLRRRLLRGTAGPAPRLAAADGSVHGASR